MFYIELTDKRCEFVKNIFETNGKKVFELTENNIKKLSENDTLIFSPAKKFDENFVISLPDKIKIYCGNVSEEIEKIFENKQILHKNITKNEFFIVKNANLTSEGVLSIILTETNYSISEAKILVLGGGRLAKSYAILFSKLNIPCTILARREVEIAQSFLFVNDARNLEEFEKIAKNFNIIVNTIPAKIFDEKMINAIKEKTLFIETASVKCLDEKLVKNFNFYFAPGLPGKIACKSAGEIMAKVILEDLENGT